MTRTRSGRLVPLALLLTTAVACAPIQRGRLTHDEPPSARELDAEARVEAATCSGAWSWAMPGAGQFCLDRPVDGAVLTTLATTELAGAFLAPPGILSLVSLVAIQNTWIVGVTDAYLDEQRASRRLYVSQDSLAELVIAPFNPLVLAEPDVWLGIIGTFGAAIAYTALLSSLLDQGEADAPAAPTMTPSALETAQVAGVSVALFTHVGIGEEMLFRGMFQASLARVTDPWTGWALGSVVFGAVHMANAFVLPPEDRVRFLSLDVPFITLVGSYLGLSTMWNAYSLAPSVAIHFWYDTLLTLGSFIGSGGELPFSMVWGSPF